MVIAAAWLAAVIPSPVPAARSGVTLRQAKQRSAERTRRIERLKEEIRTKERTERAGVLDLARYDRELAAMRKDLRALGDERESLERRIGVLTRQQRLTTAQARQANGALGEELRAWQGMDRDAPAADVALWCGAGVAERLQAARLSRAERQQRQGRLAEHLTRLGRVKGARAVKQRQLEAKRRERGAFVGRTRQERLDAAGQLREEARQKAEMDRLVVRLEEAGRAASAPRAAIPVSARVRQLAWPVRGGLLVRFGRHTHPVFNATVNSAGIEIAASAGASVSAALAGRVVYADWLPGFGRVMIVDHGNGFYTVYGHLEDSLVEKGADVQRGTRVGTVGDDGTAGRPSLYFEVRSRGKAVDPMKYLS